MGGPEGNSLPEAVEWAENMSAPKYAQDSTSLRSPEVGKSPGGFSTAHANTGSCINSGYVEADSRQIYELQNFACAIPGVPVEMPTPSSTLLQPHSLSQDLDEHVHPSSIRDTIANNGYHQSVLSYKVGEDMANTVTHTLEPFSEYRDTSIFRQDITSSRFPKHDIHGAHVTSRVSSRSTPSTSRSPSSQSDIFDCEGTSSTRSNRQDSSTTVTSSQGSMENTQAKRDDGLEWKSPLDKRYATQQQKWPLTLPHPPMVQTQNATWPLNSAQISNIEPPVANPSQIQILAMMGTMSPAVSNDLYQHAMASVGPQMSQPPYESRYHSHGQLPESWNFSQIHTPTDLNSRRKSRGITENALMDHCEAHGADTQIYSPECYDRARSTISGLTLNAASPQPVHISESATAKKSSTSESESKASLPYQKGLIPRFAACDTHQSPECQQCHQKFKGKHAASNLKRHFNSKHLNSQLECHWEKCTHRYNRSDNLLTHFKKVHLPQLSSQFCLCVVNGTDCSDFHPDRQSMLDHFQKCHLPQTF